LDYWNALVTAIIAFLLGDDAFEIKAETAAAKKVVIFPGVSFVAPSFIFYLLSAFIYNKTVVRRIRCRLMIHRC
jgi:hypothetical protein